MMENGSIRQLLHNRHVAIVDGAMATELEKHGVDTSGELWSAAALLHQRQAIYDVHMSYLEAGADFATTNTYQANPEAFANIGLSESESRTLIAQAVQEAKRACTDWGRSGTPPVARRWWPEASARMARFWRTAANTPATTR